ncbi:MULTISPECIES: hypothetical protein [unclassified Leptolyngbya]|uniref:hypothetical protein n=1 Tax=unclassified Leptolyngbya TaxID=2650499 RepID=UPI00168366C2|nr:MULTISPECIES: hypothetical protein [unclassified Leptolyngbya]MBD1910105.1 hypothetical protein [Leptolyngbya sp. FACHB-8]MBD2156877.1 hypothetical protein [Leptolyngbya sp. FACHB-16]
MQYGPGTAATFLYYFTSTAVVFTLIAAKALGAGIDGVPQQVGLLGGLLGGLVGAYFNRTITFTVETNGKDAASKKLMQALKAMGYEKKSDADGIALYERSGPSKLLSGKVFVHQEGKNATIASRAIHVKALKRLI